MSKLQKAGLAGAVAVIACMVLVGGTSLLTDNIALRCLAGLTSIVFGYLAYEFGDVLKAIPIAAKGTLGVFVSLAERLSEIVKETTTALRKWATKPHPFLYGALVITALPTVWVVQWSINGGHLAAHPGGETFAILFTFCVANIVTSSLLFLLAFAGARVEQKNLEKEPPTTYAEGFRWMVMGTGVIGSSITLFFYYLIKLVHSSERLVVTVDGNSIGLALVVGYWYYGPASSTLLDYLLLLFFGGVLGMVAVMVSVRYVAPRFGYNFLPQKA